MKTIYTITAQTVEQGRGYYGIGIYNGKNVANIGTLWRSAAILGADFIFVIGKRYRKQCSDTMNTPRHIPLYHYDDWNDFFKHVPYDCPVVAVELDENSIPLESYNHRERCIYLLGAFCHLCRKAYEEWLKQLEENKKEKKEDV